VYKICAVKKEAGGKSYPYIAKIFKTFQSVGTSDGPRGWTDGPLVGDNSWTFEPVPGYANPDTDMVALSTDLDNDGPDGFPDSEDDNGLVDSWPAFWPDKLNTGVVFLLLGNLTRTDLYAGV